ncbi:MAG: hypothetical protein RMN51_09735 [Verrucomicrobiota bacterium]|nr:hypothetical protein [Limisphaera sp.]MDW8382371.1 hypothetical protein [Verrucomicrobiota bacterium]
MSLLIQKGLGLVVLALCAGLAVGWMVLRDLEEEPLRVPDRRPGTHASPPLWPSDAALVQRFSDTAWRTAVGNTNLASAFVTAYFRPPPPPPPPVRRTQKFQLTYQGFFETADGIQRAYVLINDRLAVLAPGARVVGDVRVGEMNRLELRLVQAETQTVVVPFRGTREVEVPVE